MSVFVILVSVISQRGWHIERM